MNSNFRLFHLAILQERLREINRNWKLVGNVDINFVAFNNCLVMGTPNEYLLFPSSIDNLCVKVWSIEW